MRVMRVTAGAVCVRATNSVAKMNVVVSKAQYTPPMRLDSTVESRRRCVLGLNLVVVDTRNDISDLNARQLV